ncbi:MAG TPA: transposase [Acidimicrobiales bacterium]|nr:transposase [Acidimicrobiales bacterium]
MKLVSQVKLVVEKEHLDVLTRTLATMNQAANEVSSVAWQHRVFSRIPLRRTCYYEVRSQFGLGAQATQSVIRKVADAYKLDKNTRREFRLDGAVTYDDRMLSWNQDSRTVSIWTVSGRITVAFVGGARQLKLLTLRKGESDLVLRDGRFFLFATCDEQEPSAVYSGKVLGIDRGIANIATCSNGKNYTGKGVNRVRHRNEQLRARLQHRGTKSAKRLLKKRYRKEQRFVTDTNHKISYRVVREAQRTRSAIALEDLCGIRDRTRVRKSQRRNHNSWSYHQLGQFIEYKTRRQGVPFTTVDPHYTSQHCPCCGHISRKNRPSRDLFDCKVCGFAGPADVVASVNIASLGKLKFELDQEKNESRRGEVPHPNAGVQINPQDNLESVGLVPEMRTVALLRPEDLSVVLLASSAL